MSAWSSVLNLWIKSSNSISLPGPPLDLLSMDDPVELPNLAALSTVALLVDFVLFQLPLSSERSFNECAVLLLCIQLCWPGIATDPTGCTVLHRCAVQSCWSSTPIDTLLLQKSPALVDRLFQRSCACFNSPHHLCVTWWTSSCRCLNGRSSDFASNTSLFFVPSPAFCASSLMAFVDRLTCSLSSATQPLACLNAMCVHVDHWTLTQRKMMFVVSLSVEQLKRLLFDTTTTSFGKMLDQNTKNCSSRWLCCGKAVCQMKGPLDSALDGSNGSSWHHLASSWHQTWHQSPLPHQVHICSCKQPCLPTVLCGIWSLSGFASLHWVFNQVTYMLQLWQQHIRGPEIRVSCLMSPFSTASCFFIQILNPGWVIMDVLQLCALHVLQGAANLWEINDIVKPVKIQQCKTQSQNGPQRHLWTNCSNERNAMSQKVFECFSEGRMHFCCDFFPANSASQRTSSCWKQQHERQKNLDLEELQTQF